ncbi:alpha/beta fold hydrolase [Undibacterium sp. TJN19]|uniref:alpha/beta fold hydrolase n=1 Tax=Undibacterium sp. TJN19 TaxID=3413055 RepID=UPI003BF06DAA
MAAQQFPSRDILYSPQAFWFGDDACPMLGWHHPAKIRDAGGSRQCGVVLCPPFGHEYMVSYLAYKHLAVQLATAGFDVCFFDYNNTGDSANTDGDRIALWQENICQAARHLRQLAGLEHIVLAGLRLGGLLAASVAKDIDAKALLLMAPVISGRAYAREMMVLRSMSALQTDVEPDPKRPAAHVVTDDELTGYEFSADTRNSMGKLDLMKMPAPGFPVYILARDDISGQEAKLANAWHHHDHALHLSTSAGYAAMMTEDAHETEVPLAAWQEMTAWLGQYFPIVPAVSKNAFTTQQHATIQFAQTAVQEQLLEFEGMFGIVSRAEHADVRQYPTVILCNIGANHHVGNHRLYVTLARTLASQGFHVLRFDKSGIGYSKATPDGLENDVHAESGVDDVSSAMHFMQARYHSPSFVLAGLCSGAYLSYLTAIRDSRVSGLVLMNQLTYRWREGDSIDARRKNSIKSTHYYLHALAKLDTWKRLFSGRVGFRQIAGNMLRRIVRRVQTQWQLLTTHLIRSNLLLGRVARSFRTMEERGTELLLIYDASDTAVDVMTEQLGRHARLLGDSERIHLEIFSGADHTFTPRWAQTALAKLISSHLQKRFSSASANAVK